MKRKVLAILLAFVLAFPLTACGAGEETTLTGMVVSVDGTVISLMEMDANRKAGDAADRERPQMPEGMEGFGNFDPGSFDPGSFDPGSFEGAFPQGGEGNMPQRPEGMTPPEGMTMPEDMTIPEGMTMPEDGQMPNFGGMGGGFGGFDSDAQTKQLDIGSAHISVEIDGGKASGSISDIRPGTFVTVTLNGKGEVTNVLVSARSGFSGGRWGEGNRT